jgi:hypothetical protein
VDLPARTLDGAQRSAPRVAREQEVSAERRGFNAVAARAVHRLRERLAQETTGMESLDKVLQRVDHLKRRASFAFAFASLGLGLPLWLVAGRRGRVFNRLRGASWEGGKVA